MVIDKKGKTKEMMKKTKDMFNKDHQEKKEDEKEASIYNSERDKGPMENKDNKENINGKRMNVKTCESENCVHKKKERMEELLKGGGKEKDEGMKKENDREEMKGEMDKHTAKNIDEKDAHEGDKKKDERNDKQETTEEKGMAKKPSDKEDKHDDKKDGDKKENLGEHNKPKKEGPVQTSSSPYHQSSPKKDVGTSPIVLGKSKSEEDSQKHVTIDESKNESHDVAKDSNKSFPLSDDEKETGKAHHPAPFKPAVFADSDLPESSNIRTHRDNDEVLCEGWIWKRRRIFACFWHCKYFILTKDGKLLCYKKDGTRAAKGNWDIQNIDRIHMVYIPDESHSYRIAFITETENLLFGYDDPETREYWYERFSKFVKN